MDTTLSSTELARELTLIEKVSSNKPTIPILGNVLIQADAAGGVRLAATNLEIGLVTSCVSAVDLPGTCTVLAKRLLDISRLIQDDKTRLKLERGFLHVSSGGYKAKLATLPPADFPKLPSMRGLEQRKFSRTSLRELVLKTRFAVTDKDKRYFMNGALLVAQGETVMMVSTDGHRLARVAAPYTGDAIEPVIVPTSTLDKLVELLAEGADAEVLFAVSERHLFFACDGRLLISRQIEGKFPNYERIIPKGHDKRFSALTRDLQLALQRVGLVCQDGAGVVLKLSDNTLDVRASTASVGEAQERIAVTYSGIPLSVCVNGEYVLDFLNAMSRAEVDIDFKDARSALVFNEGTAYQYVLMPRAG